MTSANLLVWTAAGEPLITPAVRGTGPSLGFANAGVQAVCLAAAAAWLRWYECVEKGDLKASGAACRIEEDAIAHQEDALAT